MHMSIRRRNVILALAAIGFAGLVPSAQAARIPVYSGHFPTPAGFSFHANVVWETTANRLRARGEVRFLGMRLVAEEDQWRIIHGNTLELDKKIKGASGLRLHVIARLRPETNGNLHWSVSYKAYNVINPRWGGPRGSKSGTVRVNNAPWTRR